MKVLKTICMCLLCVVAAACSNGNLTPAEVASKIDAHKPLTESDYEVMIDYCGDYAEKAQKYYDVINSAPSDSTMTYSEAAQELAELKAASPYVDMFRTALYAANDSQLGEKNVEKVDKFREYFAFPLPEGSGESLNIPGDAGVIMEMPVDSVDDLATPIRVPVE